MDEKIKFTQEEIKKNEVAEKKTFKIFSCDQTFTDPDVIDYLKICLREFCDANHLLGKFTDDGKYYLQNEIKKDLVQMEKEISLMEEGVFYASNSYLKKTFNFKIVVEKIEENRARAILYLLEDYLDGRQRGQFTTFVASFEEIVNGDFNIKVKSAFNLLDTCGDLHENDIPQVAILLQGQRENGIFLDELIELGSQIYVLRMLELLESAGEKGKEILKEFKEEQRKIEEEEGKEENQPQKKSKKDIVVDMTVKKKYTQLRNVLDKAIEKHGGLEKLPIKKEEIKKNLKTFVEPVKKVEEMRKNYHGHIVEFSGKKAPKPEKAMPQTKPSAKTAGKSSSSAGSSSGGDKPKAKAGGKPKAKSGGKKKAKGNEAKIKIPSYASGGRVIIETKTHEINIPTEPTSTESTPTNPTSTESTPINSTPAPTPAPVPSEGNGKGKAPERTMDDLFNVAGNAENEVENALRTGDTGVDTRESLGEAGDADGRKSFDGVEEERDMFNGA